MDDAVARAFEGKRVFVTGHTGFKGSWLCEWLLSLGAEVSGYSLPPPTQPALFDQLGLAGRLHHRSGDVRDGPALQRAVLECRPDFVFHLAAQSLVRFSYEQPVETFSTNVMGTAHLLEALRTLKNPCAAVIVTSDKCYENHEQGREYREKDALGGRDPYSASKAAAELVVSSWRQSFFATKTFAGGDAAPVALATARAGNVIGGGDWALDRIVPDSMRALAQGAPIRVRNPDSVRPWQHVLEPLSGYLTLAARLHAGLLGPPEGLVELCGPFNFGPAAADHRTVRELVEEILQRWPGSWEDGSDRDAIPEARWLHLSTEKARRLLGWTPRWRLAEAVAQTVSWHRDAGAVRDRTRRQIGEYVG
jgi:CDP-glucose 4,6-dehydratase